MREATYLILTALAGGERHGYGIVQEVESMSEGRVRLGTGTLYGALERLQNDGMISVTREEVVEGRTRRYYRLTRTGRAALVDEIERLEANAAAARTRLRLSGAQ
jgi:PadR family transcriptional regulator PadR